VVHSHPPHVIALSLIGEGESFYRGERMPTHDAMAKAGIPVPGLHARDGLAAINGSNLITGIGCLLLHDAERWTKQAEIAAAIALEALLANMRPYQSRLHELRGFKGAVTCAANLRAVMDGSDLMTGKLKVKVQDAYSMRSTPQVIGALRDALAWTRAQFEIELNGVADNPVFDAEENKVYTGANFQGSPISMPLDMIGAGVTMVSVLSERRLNRLLNPALSVGLPAFLTRGAGMYSGLMLSQYTADMLIVEQRILSTPSCIQSIPAAADQEDFVSMGMNGALGRQIVTTARRRGDQADRHRRHRLRGVRLRPWRGRTSRRRNWSPTSTRTGLIPDHHAMAAAVERCSVLDAVEREVGPLASSWS
jgi:histidine ammonia-lyase